MKRARIELVKSEIISFFDAQQHRVFTISEFDKLISQHRELWKLPKSTTTLRVADVLVREKKLWVQRFQFSFHPITLLFWGGPDAYEIAMALRPKSYLSHYSAMQYHGLITDDVFRIVYVNDEQEAKPMKNGGLTQDGIDTAFKRRARVSNNRVKVGDISFCLLSGKHTGRLGVIEVEVSDIPVPVRVTNIERTLIDAVVRPAYSGSIHGVLGAYRMAAGQVDVEQMADMLKKLQYVYPYHQAVGFYLERAGIYDTSTVDLFHRFPKEHDFYLDYEMGNAKYSKEWRIYYPEYLKF